MMLVLDFTHAHTQTHTHTDTHTHTHRHTHLCVRLVERVLRVDEHRVAPRLLHLGDGVQRQRRLAAGLGAKDLGGGR